MEDTAEGKQTYAQKWEAKLAEKKAPPQEEKKSPEQAGQQRVDYLAEQFKKGKEFFQAGFQKVRERAQNFGQYAREGAVFLAGLPERVRDGVEAAKLGVEERLVRLAKLATEADDKIADGAELRLAKLTGKVESFGLNVKAGITESGAKYNGRRKSRVNKHMENGHQALRTSIRAKEAMIAMLQKSLDKDNVALSGKLESEQSKAEAYGGKETDLAASAQASRLEAGQRNGNGRGLAGLRQGLSAFIRS